MKARLVLADGRSEWIVVTDLAPSGDLPRVIEWGCGLGTPHRIYVPFATAIAELRYAFFGRLIYVETATGHY